MKTLPVLLVCLLAAIVSTAQDSTNQSQVRKLATGIYRNYLHVRSPGNNSFTQNSEAGYQAYAGWKIRKLVIEKLGFGEEVTDSSKRMANKVTRLANNLMTGTKAYILRQFIFIREGSAVEPFQVADNERLLRQLDFIKDARIELEPVGDHEVDLILKVRDVFSIGVKGTASGIAEMEGTLYDANLFGWAQRLEYSLRYDSDRHPPVGSSMLYRKYNIAGSFVNGEFFWSGINTGTTLGREYESSARIKLDRPLYTPNAKWTGGLELSTSKSVNRTEKPDSLFRSYAYHFGDIWVGYNFGTHVTRFASRYEPDNRRRKLVSLRYYNQHFTRQPNLPSYYYPYASKAFLLGNITWYKQNYIRTNYIYGFGPPKTCPWV
ncbi:MAG: hypothetical protein QM664_15325 [Flavihumibacter sp.]